MNRSHDAGSLSQLATTTIGRTLTAFAVCALALLVRPAFAAPPAGTTIGNQATATYQDAASNSYTVTSNSVTTVVQQVASLTLTADGTRVAAPGGQAVFPHVLTNTGNGTDAFSLAAVNQAGDDFDVTGLVLYVDADGNGVPDDFIPVTTTGPLAAGASYRFVAVGSVPGTRLAGDVADVRVNAASTFDGGQTAFNSDRVTVSTNAVVNVTKSLSSPNGASPSGPYTYTLTYTNSGNATASSVRLTDLVPAGMTYVPGSARWSVTGASALSDADSTDTHGAGLNTIRFDYNVATAGAVTANVNQVPPGQSGSVTFDVTVNAGLAPQVIGNIARFAYNDGAGIVGPFFTNSAPFTVDQSAAVAFTGQTVASALQGATVSFTNTLTNNGNGADVFDISTSGSSFPAGTIVQLFQADGVTPLTDSNGNLVPDVGPLAPGASYNVILTTQHGAVEEQSSERSIAGLLTDGPQLLRALLFKQGALGSAKNVPDGGNQPYRHVCAPVAHQCTGCSVSDVTCFKVVVLREFREALPRAGHRQALVRTVAHAGSKMSDYMLY